MTPKGLAGCFSAAVEGVLDEAVLRRILVDLDLGLDRVFGQKGKTFLRERIAGFNHDARFRPWIVVVDLDRDAEALAAFLGIRRALIPGGPDLLGDPKQALVSLAAHARRADIRRDLVPRPASGRSIGPGYTSRMVEFVRDHWRPATAETQSESLRRCRAGLRELGRKLL